MVSKKAVGGGGLHNGKTKQPWNGSVGVVSSHTGKSYDGRNLKGLSGKRRGGGHQQQDNSANKIPQSKARRCLTPMQAFLCKRNQKKKKYHPNEIIAFSTRNSTLGFRSRVGVQGLESRGSTTPREPTPGGPQTAKQGKKDWDPKSVTCDGKKTARR